jgi:hypothetical protein
LALCVQGFRCAQQQAMQQLLPSLPRPLLGSKAPRLAGAPCRHLASAPRPPVVTAAPSERPSKHVTIHSLRAMKAAKTPISMVTAYDFPSAVHVDVGACVCAAVLAGAPEV